MFDRIRTSWSRLPGIPPYRPAFRRLNVSYHAAFLCIFAVQEYVSRNGDWIGLLMQATGVVRMTQPLTHPLTPPDCDLRKYPFMPLDVVRLRDSDLAALETPESCWAAVLLWCASWHQIPAASLPDDDRVLANLAGFGRIVKEWMKIRNGSLRGWIKCSDGRLYHPVIAEKANEAFKGKHVQGWKTECARIKKHNQRHETNVPTPTLEEFLSQRTVTTCPEGQPQSAPNDSNELSLVETSDVPRETLSNRKGEGEGHGQGNINPTSQQVTHDPTKFRMHLGWQPSAHVAVLAKQSCVTINPEKVPEFIAHWLTQDKTQRTQAEWDKALLQSAMYDRNRSAGVVPKSPKPSASGQRQYGNVTISL